MRPLKIKQLLYSTLLILLSHFMGSYIFSQSTFYVKNGDNITKVENGDPTKLKVTEWQVRLYKTDVATSGKNYWGVITGSTAEEVMKKLKSSQDFELRFNEWAGKGRVQDNPLTNFNPLGPIAVIESDNQSSSPQSNKGISAETMGKIQDLYGQVKEYYDNYQQIMEILENKPKEQNPFENVGNVLREYSDNLKDAFRRVSALQNSLQQANNTAMANINAEISKINNDLAAVERTSAQLQSSLNTSVQSSNTVNNAYVNNSSPQPSSSGFDKFSEDLMNAFTNMDANNPEQSLKQINQIAKQFANEINNDPNADANMKELARLLTAMTSTTDDDAIMQYLQQIIDLLGKMSQ